MNTTFKDLLKPGFPFEQKEDYAEFPVLNQSESLKANAYYFGHPDWAKEYQIYCSINNVIIT